MLYVYKSDPVSDTDRLFLIRPGQKYRVLSDLDPSKLVVRVKNLVCSAPRTRAQILKKLLGTPGIDSAEIDSNPS